MEHSLGYERLWIAAIFFICLTCSASASDVKVIVNESVGVSAISADDLKSIFLLTKKSFADGSHAEPVLAKGGATHAAFLKEYLGKADDSLVSYYRNAVFSGKGL